MLNTRFAFSLNLANHKRSDIDEHDRLSQAQGSK